ncbi:signal peptide protein, partial [Staphylococcus caprae]
AATGTPNANEEQTGQPNATVTPGQGNDEINGATKPGEVSPKPEENNPAVTEPGTTAPGNTNQGTQVKPNPDQNNNPTT